MAVPVDQIDPHILPLVEAPNAFQGIHTIGSCGGHKDPGPAQWPAGTWYVNFLVDRTDAGWFALEFIAWLINNDYRRADHHVMVYPTAPPPYLNTPGQCLRWAIEGYEGENPFELADWIKATMKESYISPEELVAGSPD